MSRSVGRVGLDYTLQRVEGFGEVVHDGPVVQLLTPTSSFGPFNCAYGYDGDSNRLDRVLARFAERGCAPRVEISLQDPPEAVRSGLETRRLGATGQRVVLAAAIDDFVGAVGPRLSVERVTAGTFDRFHEVDQASGGNPQVLPADAFRHWTTLPGWHLFLARDDGVDVAAGVLFVQSDTAWLASAATLAAHRRRGAQQALMAARVAYARELGATQVGARTEPVGPSFRNLIRAGLRPVEFVTIFTALTSPGTPSRP